MTVSALYIYPGIQQTRFNAINIYKESSPGKLKDETFLP